MARRANIEEIGRAIRQEVGGFETATEQELRNLWGTFSEVRRGRMLRAIEETKTTRGTKTAKKTPAAESDAGRRGDQAGENQPEVGETHDESTSTVPDGPVQTDAGD